MKKVILLTLALLTPICFAGGKPPPVQDVPIRVDNTNLNANLNHNQLEQDQRQRQEQAQAQAQLQGQQQHSENTNNLHGGDSVSTVDSTVINETVIGDTSNQNDSTAVIEDGAVYNAINNSQKYINSYTHRDRIQHVAPLSTHNTIGGASRATNSVVLGLGYDGQEGGVANLTVAMPWGGGGDKTDSAMGHEEHRLRMANIYQKEVQLQQTIQFCISVQQQIKITPDMAELWDRCSDYLIVPKLVHAAAPIDCHPHHENDKGYMVYNGKTYINVGKAYDPDWQPCDEEKK